MNVFTNEAYYLDQFKRAQRLQRIGMGLLAVAILVNCPVLFGAALPWWAILVAYPFLISGWPVFTIGSGRLRRLKNNPRPDGLLNTELKGLNNKYSLHHFVVRDGKVIKHLLLGPAGCVVMESRDTPGPVNCVSGPNGDRWTAGTGIVSRIYGPRGLGNPSADLDQAVAETRAILAQLGKKDVPVNGLIVFTQQKDMEITSCSYPVVPLDETREAVRSLVAEQYSQVEEAGGAPVSLTTEDRRRINALIAPPQPAAQPKAASVQKKA